MEKQELLQKCLEEAVQKARHNKNTLYEKELSRFFGELFLDEGQLALIKDYLANKNITVLGDEEEPLIEDEDDAPLDENDKTAIDFYYEEIKNLPELSEEEKNTVIQRIIEGDESSLNDFINIYLPQVIELSKLYAGQGVTVEDLIGEGNMALCIFSQIAGCVENVDEMDGHVGQLIMDAMEKLISDENDDEKLIIKLSKELKKKDKEDKKENKDSKSDFDIFNGDELLKEAFLELSKEDEE